MPDNSEWTFSWRTFVDNFQRSFPERSESIIWSLLCFYVLAGRSQSILQSLLDQKQQHASKHDNWSGAGWARGYAALRHFSNRLSRTDTQLLQQRKL